ncbi:MAG: 3'(2'),5'-bisphosphate nucleotidase [Phycisphaerales bacterium]
MADLHKKLAAAHEAVAQASRVCRYVQRSLDEVRAITKDDKSPVTIADFASQAVVAKILEDHESALVLVGEEDAEYLRESSHAAHLDAVVDAVRRVFPAVDADEVLRCIDLGGQDPRREGFWTLDPIDGTKGFLRGQQYAVALAYIEDGAPVVGAMGCPNLPSDFSAPLDTPDEQGCLYTAARGQGASEHSIDAQHQPRATARRDLGPSDPIQACGSVETGHTNMSDEDRILQHIASSTDHAVGEPVRLDSQCKYAVTGRGQADAYLRLPTRPGYVERIWDHAAGALIAAEAGCTVSDIFGTPLDFSHGRGLEVNKGVVCAPPRVHALVIDAIRHLGITPA